MIKRLFMILLASIGFMFVTASVASAAEHHGQKSTHQQVKQKHKKVDVKGQHPPNRHHAKGHKTHGKKDHSEPPVTQCPNECKPKPTPPPGGWPCMKDHSCKPHKPHCATPPVKPPHHHGHHKPKPPVVKPPVKPVPPVTVVVKKPAPPVTTKLTTSTQEMSALPRTGSNVLDLVLLALMVGCVGTGIRYAGRKTSSERG